MLAHASEPATPLRGGELLGVTKVEGCEIEGGRGGERAVDHVANSSPPSGFINADQPPQHRCRRWDRHVKEQALGNAHAGHADADMIALQQRVTEQLQQQDDKILALDKQSESHRDHASQTREEITMLHRKLEELRALTSSSTVTPVC